MAIARKRETEETCHACKCGAFGMNKAGLLIFHRAWQMFRSSLHVLSYPCGDTCTNVCGDARGEHKGLRPLPLVFCTSDTLTSI
jgi:hypothetical protein